MSEGALLGPTGPDSGNNACSRCLYYIGKVKKNAEPVFVRSLVVQMT